MANFLDGLKMKKDCRSLDGGSLIFSTMVRGEILHNYHRMEELASKQHLTNQKQQNMFRIRCPSQKFQSQCYSQLYYYHRNKMHHGHFPRHFCTTSGIF